MLWRFACLLLAVCALAGCGEEATRHGEATLWVTRDRGSKVLVDTRVPAGISALEALRREADVETRYGGRFVQAINGIEGDISGQRDWFWFVNGYEGDRSAADYDLHDGDVLWWDLRSWAAQMRQPVVVGAFPEPFVHGFDGKRRLVAVYYTHPRQRETARRLARLLGGRIATGTSLPQGEFHEFEITREPGLRARFLRSSSGPGAPVVFTAGEREAARLADDPSAARFRYEGLP
jgi:hypothetical protein